MPLLKLRLKLRVLCKFDVIELWAIVLTSIAFMFYIVDTLVLLVKYNGYTSSKWLLVLACIINYFLQLWIAKTVMRYLTLYTEAIKRRANDSANEI